MVERKHALLTQVFTEAVRSCSTPGKMVACSWKARRLDDMPPLPVDAWNVTPFCVASERHAFRHRCPCARADAAQTLAT